MSRCSWRALELCATEVTRRDSLASRHLETARVRCDAVTATKRTTLGWLVALRERIARNGRIPMGLQKWLALHWHAGISLSWKALLDGRVKEGSIVSSAVRTASRQLVCKKKINKPSVTSKSGRYAKGGAGTGSIYMQWLRAAPVRSWAIAC